MNPVWHEAYLVEAEPVRKELKCGVSARLTIHTKRGVELVDNFVHRIKAE
jgi:hypothetical protein